LQGNLICAAGTAGTTAAQDHEQALIVDGAEAAQASLREEERYARSERWFITMDAGVKLKRLYPVTSSARQSSTRYEER
jgi:hypothetical protein